MGCPVSQVVGGRVVLGVVVCHVGGAFFPVKAELALGSTASEPMEMHPDHLDPALNDCVLDESGGSGIVSLDGRWWLFPTHFFERIAQGDHFACCDV